MAGWICSGKVLGHAIWCGFQLTMRGGRFGAAQLARHPPPNYSVWNFGTSREFLLFWSFDYSPAVSGLSAQVWIPGWSAVLPAAVLTGIIWRRDYRFSRAGLCKQCGYDIRGLKMCPECGAGAKA